jgi:AraC family transcriptional activator of pobA
MENTEDIINFRTITEYNTFNNHKTLHPLVSIVDLGKADPRLFRRFRYDFYTVFLKKVKCGDLRYGLNNYDYEEGTLVFLAPGQVIGENKEEYYQPQGTALVFHSDLLQGTPLAKHMLEYTFFSYAVNEALHLSDKEKHVIADCFAKIEYELQNSIDKHSRRLIVSNIELFLNYCIRFYDRQFITRDNVSRGVVDRFESLINGYFASEKPYVIGLPSVAYCADQLNLSANYFGDLIKRETGKTAQEHIQDKLIEIAKTKIFDGDKTVNQIAYELGFKYPQHFIRLFKKRVGSTPNEYRSLN